MKKMAILIISFSIVFIIILISGIIFQYGFAYKNKEISGKYTKLISTQFNELNTNYDPVYYLPDEYHFFGRYIYTGGAALKIVDDRMVYRIFFEYKGDIFYVYYSEVINFYEITYPNVYFEKNNQKAFALWENPEGYFIIDNYLYYAYGKDYYHTRTFGAFTDGQLFSYQNFKDYQYAKLHLDTFVNENISKEQYEEKHTTLK